MNIIVQNLFTGKGQGYPGEEAALSPPPVEEVVGAFRKELERFIDSETFRKIFRLKVQIRKYGDHPRYFNRLAVLYAGYGQYKRAEKELERLLAREEYAPALVNLGNIYYLKKDMQRALACYERAQEKTTEKAELLLALARVHHELGNFETAEQSYDKLKQVSPELAGRFAYPGLKGEEATRAAEKIHAKEKVIWDVE